jgi:TPR repeat protein
MHEFGLGTKKDFRAAFQYYKKAAILNHCESMSKCGDFIYSGRLNGGLSDKNEAIKYYKKAAELGSSTAINSLGLMTESQNREEALKLYR